MIYVEAVRVCPFNKGTQRAEYNAWVEARREEIFQRAMAKVAH